MKYTFKFAETNRRVGTRRNRQVTLELSRDLFDHYDVDGMLKAFKSSVRSLVLSDSNVIVKSIKAGNREFQI